MNIAPTSQSITAMPGPKKNARNPAGCCSATSKPAMKKRKPRRTMINPIIKLTSLPTFILYLTI